VGPDIWIPTEVLFLKSVFVLNKVIDGPVEYRGFQSILSVRPYIVPADKVSLGIFVRRIHPRCRLLLISLYEERILMWVLLF
jgi:hypothetical protein